MIHATLLKLPSSAEFAPGLGLRILKSPFQTGPGGVMMDAGFPPRATGDRGVIPVRRRVIFISILTCLTLSGFAVSATLQDSGWQSIVEGIDYKEFRLPGPNRAYVARMDRDNPTLTLETSIANGKLSGGVETVSGMAQRYEQSLSAWAAPTSDQDPSLSPISDRPRPADPVFKPWGARNDVVIAINGTFYNTETGVTSGGLVHSGWYAKAFPDHGGGSGFAWGWDRSAFIGECVFHPQSRQRLTNLTTGKSIEIDDINFRERGQKTILFTPQFDTESFAGRNNAEARIELTRPLGIRPYPDMTVGIVREVQHRKGSIPMPFDQVVISTYGAKASSALLDTVRVGDIVGISFELTSTEADCETPLSVGWANTFASLSGSFYFLKDGKVQSFDDNLGATQRHPRTAICFNKDFIYFLVVDGRQPDFSIGMSSDELALFCRDNLNARWGINQDGGGSSTMWVNGEVKNSPSDGSERPVANGIMMVALEPMERSLRFELGDKVKTIRATEVLFGPGSNYEVYRTVSSEKTGNILPHFNDLNGVFAKGTYWWRVDFGNAVGWVDEQALELVSRPAFIVGLGFPGMPSYSINTGDPAYRFSPW